MYFSHEREVVRRNDTWIPYSEFLNLSEDEEVEWKSVRFRTLGDVTITGGIESSVSTVEEIIQEVSKTKITERGNRADDKRSDAAMEDRKKDGYF